ncbi:MAG: DMT family transporter [Candidatus Igneacidithiobacillus chanchocoensis]
MPSVFHKQLPVLSLVLGAALWGTYWWPLRFFTDQGLGGPWLITLIYFCLAGAGTVLLRRQVTRKILRQQWRSLVLIALLGGWTNVAFMLALFHGQVVLVLLLFYLSPMWAVIFARLFLQEVIGWRGSVAVALACAGTALVVLHGQTLDRSEDLWTVFLATSSGLAFALSNVVLRGANLLSDSTRSLAIWWGCAGIGLVFAVFAPWPQHPQWPAFLIPIFAWFWVGLATASTVYGVSRLPIRVSAVIMPIEVIVGAVSAWILAKEAMSGIEIFGALLILSASFVQLVGQKARE